MLKKIICFIIAAILTVSVFTACGGNAGGGTTTAATAATAAATTAAATTAAETTAVNASSGYDESYDVTWGSWTPGGTPFEERYGIKKLMEKFNVNITFMALDGDKAQLAWNTGEIPDLQNAWQSDVQMHNDLLVDLTGYFNEGKFPTVQEWLNRYPAEAYKIVTPEGKYYYTPTIVTHTNPMIGWTLNKTALEEAGINELPDTFDDLYETLVKYKEYDPESFPLVGGGETYNQTTVFSGFVGYYIDNLVVYDYNKDRFTNVFEDTDYKDSIIYFKKLYDEGLVHPEYLTMTGEQALQDLTTRKSVVVPFWWNGPWGPDGNFEVSTFTDKMVGIPPPAGPSGMRHVTAYPSHIVGNGTIISAKCAKVKGKVDRLVEMLDWMYTEEGIIACDWGEEGVSYYVDANGDRMFTDDYKYARDNSDSTDKKFDHNYYVNHTNMMTDTWMANWKPGFKEVLAKIEKMPNTEYFRDYNAPPYPFTEDEQNEINPIRQACSDYWNGQVHQIILGKVDINEWDNIMAHLKSLNIDRAVEMQQQAYEKWKADNPEAHELWRNNQDFFK